MFYESPNRLVAALAAIAEVLPWRTVAVCRELTKLHEEVARGTAAELRELFAARAKEPGGVRGDIALVIDAPGEAEAAAGAEEAAASAAVRAAGLVAEGLRTKEVAKRLAAEFGIPATTPTGWPCPGRAIRLSVILGRAKWAKEESHGGNERAHTPCKGRNEGSSLSTVWI